MSKSAFGGTTAAGRRSATVGNCSGGALFTDVVATLEQAAGASGDRRQRGDAGAAHQERAPVRRADTGDDRLDRRELVRGADGGHGVAGAAAPAVSVGAGTGESHHSTAIDTSVPTTIGTTLATVGSGRVSTAPMPMSPTTPVMARATIAPTVDGDDAHGDADDEQDRQRRDHEHRLVGRPERGDGPVLQRERDEVDDLVADGDDGRHRSVDGADDELTGGEPGARGDEAEDRSVDSAGPRGPGPVRSVTHGHRSTRFAGGVGVCCRRVGRQRHRREAGA